MTTLVGEREKNTRFLAALEIKVPQKSFQPEINFLL